LPRCWDAAEKGDDILSWVMDMKTVLTDNRQAGHGIRKELIPKYYLQKYGVDNLYRYQLPGYHRACYTVTCARAVTEKGSQLTRTQARLLQPRSLWIND
jgi:hypothetical protein